MHLYSQRPPQPTEVVFECNQGCDVHSHTEQLSSQHETVPRANGERYHEQFSEHQSGEGYGDHVDELGLEEQEPYQHYDTTWRKGEEERKGGREGE